MSTNDAAISKGPNTSRIFWLASALTLAIAMAAVGAMAIHQHRRLSALQLQLASEKARSEKLRPIAAQRAEYQRLLTELEVRIDSISYLQQNHTGPADLLRDAEKLTTLAPDVDLLSVETSYEGVIFRGRAHSVEATAKFLTAVPGVEHFSAVDLTNFYQDGSVTPATYYFEFVCKYSPPPPPPDELSK